MIFLLQSDDRARVNWCLKRMERASGEQNLNRAGSIVYTLVLMYVFSVPKFTNDVFLFTNGRNQARTRTSHCRGPCSGNLPAKIPQGTL